MARVTLRDLCAVRSGDKGDIADLALFADDEAAYEAIRNAVTAAVVAGHFEGLVEGPVERYEAANVLALKFVLYGALGGGAPRSLRADNLGKTLGASLLRLVIDVPDAVAASATRGERAPLPREALPAVTVRAFRAGDADHAWVLDQVERAWGWPVVTPSGAWDPDEAAANGFVAVDGAGQRVGCLTWRDDADGREIVSLEATLVGRGVGKALLDALRRATTGRLWVATMDTNTRAIDFYQRGGMDLVELRRDFVDLVRAHKPHVAGFRHALVFERPAQLGGLSSG